MTKHLESGLHEMPCMAGLRGDTHLKVYLTLPKSLKHDFYSILLKMVLHDPMLIVKYAFKISLVCFSLSPQ